MSSNTNLANKKNSQSVEIQDSGSLHRYRTEIPNIIFQMKLDPWAFKAYCVFKMTAGDKGVCFKANVTLSEEIGCSIPTLIKLKHQLEEEGLIKIIKRIHENGGNLPDLIQIVDIWPENMQKMSNFYPPRGGKQDLVGGVNAVNEGSKRRLHKQEPKEQELNNKTTTLPPPKKVREKPDDGGGGFFDCLKEIDIKPKDKVRLSSLYPEPLVKKVLKHVSHPSFKPQKSLDASIFYFCKNPDHIAPHKDEIEKQKQIERDKQQEIEEERKRICESIFKDKSVDWRNYCYASNEYFQVLPVGDQSYASREKYTAYYRQKDFKQRVNHYFVKFDYPVPKQIKELR